MRPSRFEGVLRRSRFDPISASRVGSDKNQGKIYGSVILLMVGDRYEGLEPMLRMKGYTVVAPSTPDQAVALSLHNRIAAALIDQMTLAKEHDWSLAHSLKAVSPNTPVLLIVRGRGRPIEVPPSVDGVVSDEAPRFILEAIQNCLAQAG